MNRLVSYAILVLAASWYPFNLLVDSAVARYFPDYDATESLFKILFAGAGIVMICHYEHFVVAIQKTERLLLLNLVLIVITGALLLIGLAMKMPVTWFAWVFVAGRFLYYLGTKLLARRAVKEFRSLPAFAAG
jgi:hypothetical protein